ncbi:hypothetical protein Golob_022086, partial [Gossypium lobatum]|nr:hypothetical protein [Gossypium lobatum]
ERVVTLKESIGDVKGRIDDVNDKNTDGEDALEAMMTTFKKEITELNGELTIYKAALGNRGLVVVVPKLKEFKEARFTKDVDNFLWGIKQYFHAKDIMDDVTKVINATMYFTDVTLLWWRHRSTNVRRGGTEIGTWEEF